jgi:hypothetical protein
LWLQSSLPIITSSSLISEYQIMSSSATTFEHSKGEETPAPLELDPDQCMDNVMGYEEEENQNNGGISTHSTSSISLPKKKSGIFGTSSNLVNSIVGAGIVGEFHKGSTTGGNPKTIDNLISTPSRHSVRPA